MTKIIERLLLFIDCQPISNREFEKKTGLSNGTISKLRAGNGIGADKLANICCEYPALNPNWVLKGVGNMLQKNSGVEGDIDEQNEAPTNKVQQTVNEPNTEYNKNCSACNEKERLIQQLSDRILELQNRIEELKESEKEAREERREYKEEARIYRTELRVLQKEYNNIISQQDNSQSKAS